MTTKPGFAALSAVALMVAGIAPAAATEIAERPRALENSDIAWCPDLPVQSADPSAYRDLPVYTWGNPDVRTAQKWARKQLGYQDLWFDPANFNWLVLGFSEGAAERQAELVDEFPEDIGVVAVDVEWTRRELRNLQARIGDELFGSVVTSGSTSVDYGRGMAELEVPGVTPEIVEAVEVAFPGERVCISGADPTALTQPGPQEPSGDGWTLLGYQQKDGRPSFRTGIATRPGQLANLWKTAQMPGETPVADFDRDVVLWFAAPHGSSCMGSRLDGVNVDHDRSIITPILVDPENQHICTADLRGAHHYFVALERDRLPAGPFWVQLSADDPPGGAPRERIVVDVDLTAPGSITQKGEAHFDKEGLVTEQLPVRSPADFAPRQDIRYAIDARCGITSLGMISDIHWTRADDEIPLEWSEAMTADGEITAMVRIRGGKDPRIVATVGETSLRYDPTREGPVPCEPEAAEPEPEASPLEPEAAEL